MIAAWSQKQAVSGNEQSFIAALQQQFGGKTDALGNLIVQKGEQPTSLAVVAYCDEPGIFISHREENGRLRFCAIGTLSAADLQNRTVRFRNGAAGVVCCDVEEKPTLADCYLYADGVQVGDVGCIDLPFWEDETHWFGKALDRSVGCHIAASLLELPLSLTLIFSTQFYVGKKGMLAALSQLQPEYAILLDGVSVKENPKTSPLSLGKGPVLKCKEGSFLADGRLLEFAKDWPCQRYVSGERSGKQPLEFGVMADILSIPMEQNGVFSQKIAKADVETAIRLLQSFCVS